MATLHLTHEVAQERFGKDAVVDVIFRDEELIPDSVVDFVNEYRQKPWVRLRWYAVPLASTKYILGVCRDYTQWDPARQWVRQPPAWAIRLPEGDKRTFDQYSTDDFIADDAGFRGKTAFVTGVRASESIIRHRSCINKLNDNFIVACASNRVWLAKPIFDWQEDDVFRFFYDRGIKYCPIYDAQLFSGQSLRVSTPIHAEQAKRFDKLKLSAPVLYSQVISVFPEMLVQEKYYKDLDRKSIVARYATGIDGIRAWIVENITDEHQLRKALTVLKGLAIRMKQMPESYPPDYILKQFMAGAFKRSTILPLKPKAK